MVEFRMASWLNDPFVEKSSSSIYLYQNISIQGLLLFNVVPVAVKQYLFTGNC